MATVCNRQNFIVLMIVFLILAVSGLLIYCLVGDYRSEVRRETLFADRDFQYSRIEISNTHPLR
jgi:heme/copper-type cytochrome/quinol oxidase subunit 2